jgi:hypothetical protein
VRLRRTRNVTLKLWLPYLITGIIGTTSSRFSAEKVNGAKWDQHQFESLKLVLRTRLDQAFGASYNTLARAQLLHCYSLLRSFSWLRVVVGDRPAITLRRHQPRQ